MERVIPHCDLNNFFASVSLLYNQTLIPFPVAVAGSSENRHGIILAKNEIAKKYGIKTAEPVWQAKNKCPDLCILPPIYEKYEEFSRAAKEIYYRYTDIVEPFGIDECWLDVTHSAFLFGNGKQIAERIRKEIKEELGITVSVGVSFNKVFAKLGSDLKKPDAVSEITKENFKEVVWPLPAEDLLFVGKSTAKRLKELGIYKIGDIAACHKETLKRALGKNGEQLYLCANGIYDTPLVSERTAPLPKSIGKSETGKYDLNSEDEVWNALLSYSEEISIGLREKELYANGIQLIIRTPDLAFKEFSQKLNTPTNVGLIIAKAGMELFNNNKVLPLRSVGIRAINLKQNCGFVQQNMFGEDYAEKQNEIENEMDEINKKFGKNSIKRASVMLHKNNKNKG
jgi:DNA polymerase-4